MSINNIQDELRGLNSDLPKNNNPFHVPDGYFEGVADSVLLKVKQQNISSQEEIKALSPLLATISREVPYQIPVGFFDSLSSVIPGIISEENESEVLIASGKTMPFHVPVGYFEKFPATVLSKLSPKNARIIPMFTGWKKIAMAAMITGIIGVSGIFLLNNKPTSKDPIAQIKNVSTNDIEAFLRNTGASLSSSSVTAQNSVRKTEIQSMIQNVPDNEVDAFLKQVPEEESITN